MTTKPITCLNGAFVNADRAAVPVADRGFRFGDGVFESIRVVRNVPYQWEFHHTRLLQGLAALRIAAPQVDLAVYARQTLIKNALKDGYLRIAISRGVGSRGYLPFPAGMLPSWVIEPLAAVPPPTAPAQLWLSQRPRIPAACLPVQYKLAQGIGSTLAILDAQENACDEALQLTTDGYVCEAASANIFWIKGKEIFTPSLETGCLNGSTREALLRLSPVPVRTVVTGLATLAAAEAVFLSNCRVGVWPVAQLLPAATAFNPQHSLLAALATLLADDQINYAKTQRMAWVKP